MKASNPFKQTIKAYLDKRSAEDELFAVTYKKKNKNLDECCNYVMKCAKEGKCAGYSDEEVFGWAVHYYDEDDIKNVPSISGNVVVNHTVELTEDDKQKAKNKAIEIATKSMIDEVKKDLKVNVQLTDEEIQKAKQKAMEKVAEDHREKLLEKKKKKSIPELASQQEEPQGSLF